MNDGTFNEVTWDEISHEIKEVNPELYHIIKNLSPGPRLRLYVGQYPFGHKIVREGKFHIYQDDKVLPIDSNEIPQKIQNDLIYNAKSNPVSLVLNKSLELYLGRPTIDNLMTLMTIPKGAVISTSMILSKQFLHPPFLWNITSGARSVFMLPKISHARMYRRLCADLSINIEPPTSPYDHWSVFREIAKTETKNQWQSKVLYFSKDWFKQLDDPLWVHFKNYLLQTFSQSYNYMGNTFSWDYVFNLILKNKRIKPSLYVNNAAKHLFQIGIGFLPGMAPASDESMAPIKYLQKAFIESYQLKNYTPTIMQPTRFIMGNKALPAYYSLQNPSLLDTPKKRDNSSQISDLYDIQALFNKYRNALIEDHYNISETEVARFLETTSVKALHTNPDKYSQIHEAESITKHDNRFSKSLYPSKNKEVATHSPFFRGCFSFNAFEK